MNGIREWIKRGVHKPGKSVPGLAQAITKALKLPAPMHRGTIYKMMAGTREVRADELSPIAEYIGEPIPIPTQSPIGDFVTIPIEREVRPGIWAEAAALDSVNLGNIIAPRDDEFPREMHRAFLFRGDSMKSAGLLDGDIVICIEQEGELASGKLVIIERSRGGLVEFSVRTANAYKDRIELVDDKNPPLIRRNTDKVAGRKIKADVESINIVAVVRRITRNVK